MRDCDIPVRFGGEEFALILPSTGKPGALQAAERTRRRIAIRPIACAPQQPRSVTVSLGVASVPDDATDAGALLETADRALYEAKRRGKNRVCPDAGP